MHSSKYHVNRTQYDKVGKGKIKKCRSFQQQILMIFFKKLHKKKVIAHIMLTPHRLKLTEISTTREMGVSNITANLQVTFFPTIYTQNSINNDDLCI